MKGMGGTAAYFRRGIREIICLALFYFTFLAGEYLFDMRVAEFVPPSEVATYETLIVGASVIGFFVRPILYYRRPRAIDTTSDITGVLLVSALLLMIMAVRFEVVIAGGLMACCTLGYCGSTAHANFARRFARTPYLARAAALSYALGVLLQVFSHMVIPAGIPQQLVLLPVQSRRWRSSTASAVPSCAANLSLGMSPISPSFRWMHRSLAPNGKTIPSQRRLFGAPWCV